MENIRVLPTEKPSKKGDIIIWNGLKIWNGIGEPPHHNQNIYITSDEKIKEGDWCYQVELNDGKVDKCYDVTLYHTWTNNGVDKTRRFKKIILTTDQDLIKDGVQAIPDDFLEWFVKNPSCEEVEIDYQTVDITEKGEWIYNYKIIIPKQTDWKDSTKALMEAYGDNPKDFPYEEPKQETLEEVAEKFVNNTRLKNPKSIFCEGAKWQQERSYSEEEVLDIIENAFQSSLLTNKKISILEWFEQFKKK